MAYNKENFHYIQLTGERYVRCLSSISVLYLFYLYGMLPLQAYKLGMRFSVNCKTG